MLLVVLSLLHLNENCILKSYESNIFKKQLYSYDVYLCTSKTI